MLDSVGDNWVAKTTEWIDGLRGSIEDLPPTSNDLLEQTFVFRISNIRKHQAYFNISAAACHISYLVHDVGDASPSVLISRDDNYASLGSGGSVPGTVALFTKVRLTTLPWRK